MPIDWHLSSYYNECEIEEERRCKVRYYDVDLAFETRHDAENFYYPCAWRMPNESVFLLYRHITISAETLSDIAWCIVTVVMLTHIHPVRVLMTPAGEINRREKR